MAKFKTACPACNSAISVYSEWVGKQATCPVCKSPITVPATPSNTITCPACGNEQSAEKMGHTVCSFCGETCLKTPPLSFRCAEHLPPAPDGIPRLACPYCGRHYILSFTPQHGLIGCQDCMNIFACPPPAEPKVRSPKNIFTTMVLTPEHIPAQPAFPPAAPVPETPAMQTMQLTPQPILQAPHPPAMQTMQLTPLQSPSEQQLVQPAPLVPLPEEPQAAPDTSCEKSKLEVFLLKYAAPQTAGIILIILRIIGNIIWMLMGGLFSALVFAIYGILFCLTIILIPFGLQMFKLAGLALCPFGADVRRKQQTDKVGCLSTGLNIIWLLFGGLILAAANFIAAIIFFITVIGIPFALQNVKLGKLVLTPFGLEVRLAPGMKIIYIIAGILAAVLISLAAL